MKPVSSPFRSISKGYREPDPEVAIGYHDRKNQQPLPRLLLLSVRSPSGQLQIVTIPLSQESDSRSLSDATLQTSIKHKPRKSFRGVGLKKISGGVGLTILGLGFPILGLLSLINGSQRNLSKVAGIDVILCDAAGIASLLVGAVFLIITYCYWRRCISTDDQPVLISKQMDNRSLNDTPSVKVPVASLPEMPVHEPVGINL